MAQLEVILDMFFIYHNCVKEDKILHLQNFAVSGV